MRVLAALLLGTLTASCAARRHLVIETDPPGAEIRLDDRRAGRTPKTIDFGHYGVRRVTLHLDGYRTYTERIELSPPWYARFPFDLVSELMLPIGWRDRRELRVKLERGEELMTRPGLRSVLERADVLRHAGPAGPTDLPRAVARELPSAKDAPEPQKPPVDDPQGDADQPNGTRGP